MKYKGKYIGIKEELNDNDSNNQLIKKKKEFIIKEIFFSNEEERLKKRRIIKDIEKEIKIYDIKEKKNSILVVIDLDEKSLSIFEKRIKEIIPNLTKEYFFHGKYLNFPEVQYLYEFGEKRMCKIEINNIQGTGFFLKIDDDIKLNIPLKKVLLTNNHIISKKNIIEKSIIKLNYLDNNKSYISKYLNLGEIEFFNLKNNKNESSLNQKRKIFTDEFLDYTCIEIFDNDHIVNNVSFFECDKSKLKNKIYTDQDDKIEIFVLHYPSQKDLSFSLGQILEIDNPQISHNASTEGGSSGSPLLKRENLSVIGIHYGGIKNDYNLANNIENILLDIQNKVLSLNSIKDNLFLNKSLNSNEKNEEDLKEEEESNKSLSIEDKEIKEKNITKNLKKIIEFKIDIDKLKPRNPCGKFLVNIKFNNKGNQNPLKGIIENFMNAESMIRKYITEFTSDDKKIIFFKKQGFILTKKSMERLALLIHYILNGIPVLIEGYTGTAKSRTILTACHYIKKFIQKEGDNRWKFIRYNLNAETKIDDIISNYTQDSFIRIPKDGIFLDAYAKGKIIFFDNINLPPSNVLKCIQQSLDNDFLSLEIKGRGLLKYQKNPDFALLATQNPNKGSFTGKNQELGPEFLSRFQKIYFPEILKEEMLEIALGIAKNVGYLNSDDNDYNYKKSLLTDIVDLHFDWAALNDSHCFTIREIESVIEYISNGEDPYNVIMEFMEEDLDKEGKMI